MTREEALKYLKDFKDSYWDGMPEEALDMAIQALSQEPKSGKWIERDKRVHYAYWERYKCSKCGHYGDNDYKFCPNCGAYMVEPRESEVSK